MKIGIAGTGKMGLAIGQRLIALGHQVQVWNRNPARAARRGRDRRHARSRRGLVMPFFIPRARWTASATGPPPARRRRPCPFSRTSARRRGAALLRGERDLLFAVQFSPSTPLLLSLPAPKSLADPPYC